MQILGGEMYTEYQGENSMRRKADIRVNKWIHLQNRKLSVNSITDNATSLPTSTNPASTESDCFWFDPLPNFQALCFAFHIRLLPNRFHQETALDKGPWPPHSFRMGKNPFLYFCPLNYLWKITLGSLVSNLHNTANNQSIPSQKYARLLALVSVTSEMRQYCSLLDRSQSFFSEISEQILKSEFDYEILRIYLTFQTLNVAWPVKLVSNDSDIRQRSLTRQETGTNQEKSLPLTGYHRLHDLSNQLKPTEDIKLSWGQLFG